MLKALKSRWPLLALAGMSTVLVGLVVGLLKTTDAFNPNRVGVVNPNVSAQQAPDAVGASEVLALANQPAVSRSEALRAIAQKNNGIERDRARYMLATDYINQGQNEKALPLLDGLENSYKDLAGYVLLRRGQAQAAIAQPEAAIATWTELTQQYPDSTATAEALYQLGLPAAGLPANSSLPNSQPAPLPASWVQLIESFPSHPLSINVAFRQAASLPAKDPAAFPFLRQVAIHGLEHPQFTQALNRLESEYSSQLTAEDWEAIGFGYWETQNYGKAGDAYAKAPGSPRTQYRAARGKERGGKSREAVLLYQLLGKTFPEHPETASGLLNLAD